MFHFLLLFLSLILKSGVHAAEFSIESKFNIDVPANWRATENLFGIPLVLSGPMQKESRPIISITPTGLKDVEFSQKEQAKILMDYKEQRIEWLKKHNGKLLTMEPYKNAKWPSVDEVHILGYSYKINDIVFHERTFYVLCNLKLFHLKYLLRDSHKEYFAATNKIIESFKCKE